MDNFWFNVDQIGQVAEPIFGSGSATMVNPKLNFIFTPFNDNNVAKATNLFLNFGGGFHSNDARVFVQDPDKKIPRYWGGELGSRSRLFDRLDMTLSYWRSYLESELVFVGDEGTFEPAGPSNRHGVETELRYDILPWLTYDIDLSYTWARFTNGDYVPLAPRFLAFTGITARHDSGIQARLQMRHVGQRYGIEDGSIKVPPATVFDLFLKYVWKRYEFFVQFQNLANTKWRAAEHVFESRTPGEVAAGEPGRLDAHYTPGDPFTVKAGVTIHLW
jgi:outer membrane receptor protein involved in Fe transport